jgi:hypothetical protein
MIIKDRSPPRRKTQTLLGGTEDQGVARRDAIGASQTLIPKGAGEVCAAGTPIRT